MNPNERGRGGQRAAVTLIASMDQPAADGNVGTADLLELLVGIGALARLKFNSQPTILFASQLQLPKSVPPNGSEAAGRPDKLWCVPHGTGPLR